MFFYRNSISTRSVSSVEIEPLAFTAQCVANTKDPAPKLSSFPCRLRQDISKLRISKCFLIALVTVIVTVCVLTSFEVYNSTAAG